jgi:hypothetical protein
MVASSSRRRPVAAAHASDPARPEIARRVAVAHRDAGHRVGGGPAWPPGEGTRGPRAPRGPHGGRNRRWRFSSLALLKRALDVLAGGAAPGAGAAGAAAGAGQPPASALRLGRVPLSRGRPPRSPGPSPPDAPSAPGALSGGRIRAKRSASPVDGAAGWSLRGSLADLGLAPGDSWSAGVRSRRTPRAAHHDSAVASAGSFTEPGTPRRRRGGTRAGPRGLRGRDPRNPPARARLDAAGRPVCSGAPARAGTPGSHRGGRPPAARAG